MFRGTNRLQDLKTFKTETSSLISGDHTKFSTVFSWGMKRVVLTMKYEIVLSQDLNIAFILLIVLLLNKCSLF